MVTQAVRSNQGRADHVRGPQRPQSFPSEFPLVFDELPELFCRAKRRAKNELVKEEV